MKVSACSGLFAALSAGETPVVPVLKHAHRGGANKYYEALNQYHALRNMRDLRRYSVTITNAQVNFASQLPAVQYRTE